MRWRLSGLAVQLSKIRVTFICSGDASDWLRVTWSDVYLSTSQSTVSNCSSETCFEDGEGCLTAGRQLKSPWQFWSLCWFWQTGTEPAHTVFRRRWRCRAFTSHLYSVFSVCSCFITFSFCSFIFQLYHEKHNLPSVSVSPSQSAHLTCYYHRTTIIITSLPLVVVDVGYDIYTEYLPCSCVWRRWVKTRCCVSAGFPSH